MIDPRTQKGLDLIVDVAKLLITVATAVVTFTTTIMRPQYENRELPLLIATAIVAAVASVLAGLLTILVVTGVITSKQIAAAQVSATHWAIVLASTTQLIGFMIALGLLSWSFMSGA